MLEALNWNLSAMVLFIRDQKRLFRILSNNSHLSLENYLYFPLSFLLFDSEYWRI